MKRNAKIIEIAGIKGLITTLFIAACLAAGFVAFPGMVAMNVWNYFAGVNIPNINLWQGVLLWAIVFLVYFIATRHSIVICLRAPKELSEDELKTLMERIRLQSQAKEAGKIMLKNLEELRKDENTQNPEPPENNSITK